MCFTIPSDTTAKATKKMPLGSSRSDGKGEAGISIELKRLDNEREKHKDDLSFQNEKHKRDAEILERAIERKYFTQLFIALILIYSVLAYCNKIAFADSLSSLIGAIAGYCLARGPMK